MLKYLSGTVYRQESEENDMSEVIQSLSICCPSTAGCINHCKTCTARQHENPYRNKYSAGHMDTYTYWEDVIKRMQYARSKDCTTVMLTGSNEPQQDRRWLESLALAMRSLPEPFLNIEIQTTGAFLDMDYLRFLKAIGVTTLAISTFSIFDDAQNREVEVCADKDLSIEKLCEMACELELNIRICVNVTDHVFSKSFYESDALVLNSGDKAKKDAILLSEAQQILNRCAELHANQVTFRKMWSNPGTPEAEWIQANCTYSNDLLNQITSAVSVGGTIINVLPYGAARYDYQGFSIVIDTDSMAKDVNNQALKYYIIREDGKMYSSWDSAASIVF